MDKRVGAILAILIWLFMQSFKSLGKFQYTKDNKHRDCDAWGCGGYAAPRGDHDHNGFDVITYVGEEIYAPHDCVLVRHGWPYANNNNLHLIEIKGLGKWSGISQKLMYMNALRYPVGTEFRKGQVIGYAENVSSNFYDEDKTPMQNHLHIEIYKNGKLTDPEPYLA